jgi:hypothetical protein
MRPDVGLNATCWGGFKPYLWGGFPRLQMWGQGPKVNNGGPLTGAIPPIFFATLYGDVIYAAHSGRRPPRFRLLDA